jgi:plasmid stabilization system protein ParE
MAKRWSESAADRFIAEIRIVCNDLALTPRRASARPEFGKDIHLMGGLRGRVSLLFHVGDDTVTVLGIRYAGWQYEHPNR